MVLLASNVATAGEPRLKYTTTDEPEVGGPRGLGESMPY